MPFILHVYAGRPGPYNSGRWFICHVVAFLHVDNQDAWRLKNRRILEQADFEVGRRINNAAIDQHFTIGETHD